MNKLQTGAIVLAAACMAEAAPPGNRGTLDPPAADVHCHFVTPGYLALLEKHGARMDELAPHAEAILGGNARRLFAPREQNDDTRQATRDRLGQATGDTRRGAKCRNVAPLVA